VVGNMSEKNMKKLSKILKKKNDHVRVFRLNENDYLRETR